MTHLQRSVMVMILAGIFLFGILFCSKECSEKIREQWLHIKTEQFLEKMCRVGKCSYEEVFLQKLDWRSIKRNPIQQKNHVIIWSYGMKYQSNWWKMGCMSLKKEV